MTELTRNCSGMSHHRELSNIVVCMDHGNACVRVIPEYDPEVLAQRARSIYLEKIDLSAAAEERRRTGRYLAVCLTLVMLVIACYHVLMRQMPVLVGLLAPAIIMILYLIWLLYFALKKKRTEIALV